MPATVSGNRSVSRRGLAVVLLLLAVGAFSPRHSAHASTAAPFVGLQKAHGWVDFDGDGRADWCDVTSGAPMCILSNGSGFPRNFTSGALDPGYAAGRAWVRFDSDTRADYCRVVGDWDKYLQCTVFTGSETFVNPFTGHFAQSGVTITSGKIDPGYDAGRAWVDVTGDGRADYCRVVGSWDKRLMCTTSADDGFVSSFTSGVEDPGWDAGRAWVDFNGDKLADYCRVVGSSTKFFQCTVSTGSGFGRTFTSAPLDPGYDAYRRWTDFNGDGKADFCRTITFWGDRLRCSLSTGTGSGGEVTSAALDRGYVDSVAWADVNGDAKADYCREIGSDYTVLCTLSTGGGFGQDLRHRPGSSTPARIGWTVGWVDFNGDAMADYCRITVSEEIMCTVSAGNGFGATFTGPFRR